MTEPRMTLITGPMFSGKSSWLINQIFKGMCTDKEIVLFTPPPAKIIERKARNIKRIVNKNNIVKDYPRFSMHQPVDLDESMAILNERLPDILLIDEGHFFDYWIVDMVRKIFRKPETVLTKIDIAIAGLDMDAWGRPIGPMDELFCLATNVRKLTAKCFKCGKPARYSYKANDSKKQIEVGDKNIYEARCHNCHDQLLTDVPGI